LISTQHLTVKRGETFCVELSENATTGYRWVAPVDSTAATLEEDRTIRPSSRKPGAAGCRVFTFRATQTGSHRLLFALRRGYSGAALKTHELTVDIT
jgi:predicted secreted protein